MSYVVALAFNDMDKAKAVKKELLSLERQHLVDLADAAVVVRNDKGDVHLYQDHDEVVTGAVGGAFWGTLVGLIFMAPVLGLGVGAVSGAIAGAVADVGIDDDFMKSVGRTLEPSTSALFILVRQATLDKVFADLRPYGGKLLYTSLSRTQETELRQLVDEAVQVQADAAAGKGAHA